MLLGSSLTVYLPSHIYRKEVLSMFFNLFKKETKENAKIQELEQTIRELSVEVDSLKRSISEKERQPERVVDKSPHKYLQKKLRSHMVK